MEKNMDVDKIIEKMKNQPHGIRNAEAIKVLEYGGYTLDRQKGSHMQFVNKNGDVFTLKKETPLKAVYVKEILARCVSNQRGENESKQ